jgi:hypothetical protein
MEYLSIYGCTALVDLGRFFSRTPWTEEQPTARPLATYRKKETQNKRKTGTHVSSEVRNHDPGVREGPVVTRTCKGKGFYPHIKLVTLNGSYYIRVFRVAQLSSARAAYPPTPTCFMGAMKTSFIF